MQVVTTDPNKTVPILDIKPSNYGITKLLMVRWTEELASREKAAGDSINKLRWTIRNSPDKLLRAGTGVTTYSVDPGFVNTSMASQTSAFWTKLACEDEGN